MKVVKSLFPIITLIIVAFYGYQKYYQLPVSASIGITYLAHMLAIIVAGLSIRFSRSSLFFYVLLVVIVNVLMRLGWAKGDLAYSLLSAFIPLLLMILTILPDRGIFSIKAIPAYAILLLVGVFSITVLMVSPAWATHVFLTDWLPPQYFDWTDQSQTVLIISFATLYILLTLCILNPSLHMAAGFGVLLMLIAELHYGHDSRSLNVFGSAALLMCLYAIMQETWRMAYLDELTGLPGRRALGEKFRKISGLYTVAMLDVDHFKQFNDTYGHDAGDAVLRMIAAKMSKVSGGGMSYRYGGEEFTVVFTGKDSREAVRHLEVLREAIASKPFVIRRVGRRENDQPANPEQNKSIQVTVSIGFADSGGNKTSPWDVLKLSDKALYRAKGKGRNCVSE
jgi:diguanylate cyclase (GGDEF)-like protein